MLKSADRVLRRPKTILFGAEACLKGYAVQFKGANGCVCGCGGGSGLCE
jgi:hypothetical protein